MGRNGVLSSAAVGGSLIAASLVLVVGVAGLIGFRGFDSANTAAEEQSVVDEAAASDREAGATASPAAVIGSAQPQAARRASRATRRKAVGGARRATRRATARGGLSAPASPRSAASPDDVTVAAPRATPATDATTERTAPSAPAPAPPDVVEEITGVVDDVTRKPVESVGDLLLDVRDLLP